MARAVYNLKMEINGAHYKTHQVSAFGLTGATAANPEWKHPFMRCVCVDVCLSAWASWNGKTTMSSSSEGDARHRAQINTAVELGVSSNHYWFLDEGSQEEGSVENAAGTFH